MESSSCVYGFHVRFLSNSILKLISCSRRVGPLSIQIKERKKATTRARLRKDARQEVQPAQLQAADIQRSENETTKMVPLVSQALLRTGDAGVTLFEFVINPQSFGQSVENLFYVSFLVKEGKAAVYPEELEGGGEGILMLCECYTFIITFTCADVSRCKLAPW